MLNGELYTQNLQKLIYLYVQWSESFVKQPVGKYIDNFCNFCVEK